MNEVREWPRRGVSLGCGWEAPPGTWGCRHGVEDVADIAAAGFDHLRIPVAWHHHFTARGIAPELLAELRPVVEAALARGLGVWLTWQEHPSIHRRPWREAAAFLDGWRRIAGAFSGWPAGLWFELLNEPHGRLRGRVLNRLYRDAIAAIREIDAQRMLVVEPGHWGRVSGLSALRLPAGETGLLVSVHGYAPFPFTHQGAPWCGLGGWRGLRFPGPPAEHGEVGRPPWWRADLWAWWLRYRLVPGAANPCSRQAVGRPLARAVAWSQRHGRPVHLGEFGAHRVADGASRRRYAAAVRREAEALGLPWAWWDWKGNFSCREDGVLEVLMGEEDRGHS